MNVFFSGQVRRQILSGMLAGLLAIGATVSTLPAHAEQPAPIQARPFIHITLLQLNDVYQLAPASPSEAGGLARIATLRKRIATENPNTLLILAGDTLSPTPGGTLFYGKQMIDLWNQVGLNLAALGNHEFDYGNDILIQRIRESQFPWLAANVVDKNTGQPFGGILPSVIREMGGVKVGFFGLLTPDTRNASSAGPNVAFNNPTLSACATVSALRRQGAEVIVAVTHLTMEEDKRVAQNMNHGLALIMGGHEHSVLQSVASGVPIYKVGSDARALGRYDLWIDAETHRLESMDVSLIPVDQSIPDDPAVKASVNVYLSQIEAGLGETIGHSTVPLNAVQADNRSQETNLGNLLADAYRARFKTDVALLNGGSIRSNKVYPAGPVTRKDIANILQFAGPVLKVELSGKVLKQALENGVSRLGEEAGRFPQVSGLQFSYDPSRPALSRVISVRINGQPLQEAKLYTLAVPAYLVQKGGDDYTMLKTVKILNDPQEAPSDSQIVQEAIQQAKTIAPKVEGRIQVVVKPNKV